MTSTMTPTMDLRCPKCAGAMVTYERSGITLDQCRECRGIFLDRGELEKLVDAEGGAWIGPQPGVPAQAVHAAPPPAMPVGFMPSGKRGTGRPQPVGQDDRDRPSQRSGWDHDEDDDWRGDDDRGPSGRPRTKRSFFADLFEGLGD